jgi:multisubunit Na+/H+ antiporter MnhF subunit
MVVIEEIGCLAFDIGMYLLFVALSISFLTGARLVARRGSTTSLVGANVATISLGTALILLGREFGIAYTREITFALIVFGTVGIIMFSRILREGSFFG